MPANSSNLMRYWPTLRSEIRGAPDVAAVRPRTRIMREASTQVQNGSPASVPHLRRVLTLWDLIFYGIVVIMPIAAVPLFGVAQKLSKGHTVTTILIAMVAMMLTAVSYGRMASIYPAAGSAYTYVGRGLNPHLGFLAGWAMFLDYLLIPLLNAIYVPLTLQRLIPGLPYVAGALLFVTVITLVNLRGIRSTARTNIILLVIMCAVIGVFIVLAVRYLYVGEGWGGLFSTQPFYDPRTFDIGAIATATSFAALTYIGFDGVTTLAEDVKNPKRNVLMATVIVCLFTGIFSGFQIYLAQRVWPNWHTFPNLETAFMDVTRRVGGPILFQALGLTLIVAGFGSALAGQVGAARLLYGMGRDNVLPRKFFAHLNPKRNTPDFNIVLVGILAFLGALVLNYERCAEVLNFGAFLSFMGVNVATLWQFYIVGQPGRKRRSLVDFILPALGFLFCGWIWWHLPTPAKLIGGAWFLVGITYTAIKTRGFRKRPAMIDFSEV
jgi:amino acid transporter